LGWVGLALLLSGRGRVVRVVSIIPLFRFAVLRFGEIAAQTG
jgi:hypothetical protein